MGLFKTAATAASALGSVASAVFGAVRGVGRIGSGILKSTAGKFAIGLGAAALLLSDPAGGKSGGSFVSKLSEGFKSFIGGIGQTVASKAGGTALSAAYTVAGAGMAVNGAAEALENDPSRTLSLRDMVIDQNFEAPAQAPAAGPVPDTAAPAEPDAQDAAEMQLC